MNQKTMALLILTLSAAVAAPATAAWAAQGSKVHSYHGVSELDQSPCNVDVYREGDSVTGFVARGQGHFWKEATGFSPDQEGTNVHIDASDLRELSSVVGHSVVFKKSRSWLFNRTRYVASATIQNREIGVKLGQSLTVKFYGDESSPTKILVTASGQGLGRYSQAMTCLLPAQK